MTADMKRSLREDKDLVTTAGDLAVQVFIFDNHFGKAEGVRVSGNYISV